MNKNPKNANITRVDNGWILSIGNPQVGFRQEAEFVFTTPAELAQFILTNFRLPTQEPEGGK